MKPGHSPRRHKLYAAAARPLPERPLHARCLPAALQLCAAKSAMCYFQTSHVSFRPPHLTVRSSLAVATMPPSMCTSHSREACPCSTASGSLVSVAPQAAHRTKCTPNAANSHGLAVRRHIMRCRLQLHRTLSSTVLQQTPVQPANTCNNWCHVCCCTDAVIACARHIDAGTLLTQ
jgi:hypothetical protein